MTKARTVRVNAGTLIGLMATVLVAVGSAQEPPAPPRPAAVKLVPNQCVQISAGVPLALEWNPGFEHPGAVTGLRGFGMTFARVGEDGVHLVPRSGFSLGGRTTGQLAVPLGNGYYRVEVRFSRTVRLGTYQLVSADAVAQVSDDFHGDLHLLVSPAREHFCIIVVSPIVTPSTGVVASPSP